MLIAGYTIYAITWSRKLVGKTNLLSTLKIACSNVQPWALGPVIPDKLKQLLFSAQVKGHNFSVYPKILSRIFDKFLEKSQIMQNFLIKKCSLLVPLKNNLEKFGKIMPFWH